MRRMYSLNQIIALIQQYAETQELSLFADEYDATSTYDKGDVVIYEKKLYQAKADIRTAEAWDATHWDETNVYGALVNYLVGKFVKIMDAPSSTTLTDSQVEIIKEGVFINGNFLGLKNPVIFPASITQSNEIKGFIIGNTKASGGTEAFNICAYTISPSNIIYIDITLLRISGYPAVTPNILFNKEFPNYPNNTSIGGLISRKGKLEWYIPVVQNNITSGDVVALTSDLGKALLDHLEVEINGFRARYEYTDGNYVVYSSKTESAGGLKLQVNMISYNTTNGELSFNQMTFTPDA